MSLVSEMESISEPLILNTEDHYLEQETLILQIDNTPPSPRQIHVPPKTCQTPAFKRFTNPDNSLFSSKRSSLKMIKTEY